MLRVVIGSPARRVPAGDIAGSGGGVVLSPKTLFGVRRRIVVTALLLLLPACATVAPGPAPPPAASAAQAAATPGASETLDPVVAGALRRMSTTLAGTASVGTRVTMTREGLLPNGQHILLRSTAAVGMQRPNRLVVLAGSDRGNFRLTYDGQTAALHDLDADAFGASAFSGSPSALLQALERRFGVSIPLADLLAADPYAALVGSGTTGVYVGPTIVDGVVCDHFALRTGDLDWEVWIEASDRALPRLLSTVDRGVPEQPRTILAFEDWSLAPRFGPGAFDTTPPRGARPLTTQDTEGARTGR